MTRAGTGKTWVCAGRAQRRDMVIELERMAAAAPDVRAPTRGVVIGWSLNELSPDSRARAERAIHTIARTRHARDSRGADRTPARAVVA
jgi:hypothetical protein